MRPGCPLLCSSLRVFVDAILPPARWRKLSTFGTAVVGPCSEVWRAGLAVECEGSAMWEEGSLADAEMKGGVSTGSASVGRVRGRSASTALSRVEEDGR